MTKTELISAVAEKTGDTKVATGKMLDALSEVICENVKADSIPIPGVCTIESVERPERMVRNPATGEQVKSPAKRVPKVRVNAHLKKVCAGEMS